jgi:TANFOR domain-containing protein
MRTLRKVFSTCFTLFILMGTLHAQTYPLTISIQVNPPYTANYASYFQSASQVLLTISNSSTTTYSIFLAGSVSTIDGSISVRSSEGSPWAGAPLDVPPGVHVYNGTDLQPFAEGTNLEYTGITQQDILTGLLPEGEYQICMRAIGYNTLTPLSPAEPQGCSNIFTINYPPPPQLITPSCESSFDRTLPQNIIFSWQPPTGLPATANVRYRFTLVMLPEGIDAVSALTNPVDPVYTTELLTTTLNYSTAQPILLSPRQYAWRVQAFDPTGATPFQNEGFSEPCTFNYLEPGSNGSNFSLVYPMDGDTLPWDFMPVYQRFDPYSVNYTGFRDEFQIFRNGVLADSYTRHNSWPQGPEQSQEQALGGINITQEQAQHINMYKPMSGVSPPAISFQNGNRYNWTAELELENSGGSSIFGSLEGNFVSGMGRPRPISPANRDSVEKDTEVGLHFMTSAPPQRLVPPLSIMQTTSPGAGAHFFDGGLDERWVLEVSRAENFNTVIASTSQRLGNGLDYLNGDCLEQCLIDSLYKEVTFNYTPRDTGWYFWRVRWLSNPASASGPSYLDGPTWRFLVKDSLVTPTDSVPPTPGECVNTCEATPVPASERVPVTTAAVGTEIQVGMFTMRVTEITWSGTQANGRGTIRVPFMRAPMKVRFQNMRVNAANRYYEGTVKGEYDNASVIPSGIMEGVSRLGNLGETESQTLNAFINGGGRLVSQFAMDNPMGLPIGLDQEVDDNRVTIGIVGLDFGVQTATLNAMVALEFPELQGWLSLGAMGVCFHPDGIGGDGKGMLYLPTDHDIPFADSLKLRFNKTAFNESYTAVTDSGTYVSWDCRGFKALNVDGAVIFGRNLLVEDLDNGDPGPAQIKAEFAARFRRAGQWMARLNFNHPFQVAGAPGWGFDVQEAWLDFSDGQNPDGFSFPRGYAFDTTAFTGDIALSSIPDPSTYWKGFYLKRQMLRLPPVIESYSNPAGRLTASVNNMLIDRRGLTASFRMENLLRVSDGNLSGWGFSIDTLMINVAMNSFTDGGFVGEIRIPASDSLLVYSSMLRQNPVSKNFSYEFRIHPKDTINADLWAAKLSLAPTTYIMARIDSAGAFARAELTGSVSIDTEMDGIGRVNFRLMQFEELAFQTRAPYIDCDENCVRFGLASPQKFMGGTEMDATEEGGSSSGGMSGFPVSISDIGLTYRDGATGPRAGLQFTLSLNLTGETNTFSAGTTLAIMGKLNIGGSSGQVWEFDGVDLDSIGISGTVGVVTLSGGLRFYNGDATYGNGIKGFIQATFKPVITARVSAQFGEKSGFRYWFVDAQAVFGSGITLMAGLDLYGFGGGAWYHMRRTTPLPSAASLNTADTTGRGGPGMTLSGVTFVPDNSIAFGFSATIVFGNTGGGDAYNADVTFGAAFSESGGISSMFLNGNGYFMCDKQDRSNPQIRASVEISYDFVQNIFDARLDVYVNVAGGLVKGVNPGNLAGRMHIYASPVTWFIHVGTPDTPIGLDFLSLFQTRSYLMVGLNLPAAPPPPPEVTSIITPSTLYRHPGLASGDGFAFGSRMDFNTGRLGFLIFYARLAMGMGFDISLMNYGSDVFCEGAPPGTTIGVDGWYANGQVYAYIMGDIGIYVDLWFTSGEFKILEMGAAALLQGGLPNPSWLQGTCGGYYSILGGLVKGNCQFEFKVGQECRPAPESPLAGIDILEDLVPYNGEQNVDCGINPEASFNAEVDREFELEEIRADGSTAVRRFRFIIEQFELRKGGQLVQSERQVSPDAFKAMLIPQSFLDPHTEYVVSIRVRGQEYNFGTGTWGNALKRDGSPIVAERANTFRTGPYPERIPDNNVEVSYPFNTQRFYLQGECDRGFVKLKQWMAPLFTTQPSTFTRRSFYVRFVPIDGGPEQQTDLEFYEAGRQLNFQMPTLLNNKVYACQIISKDSSILNLNVNTAINFGNLGIGQSQQMASGAGNVAGGLQYNLNSNISYAASQIIQNSSLAQLYNTQTGGAQVRKNRIDGRTVRKNEKLLYVFFFKTSQFNTLVQKMAAFTPGTTNRSALGLLEFLEPGFTGGERFDAFDVNGFRYMHGVTPQFIRPLVNMREARTDNWNTTWAQPVIYDFYNNLRSSGYTTLRFNRANPDTLGIPPTMTVRFHVDNPTSNPLSPSEYLPYSSNPGSVFGNLIINGFTSYTGNIGFGSGYNLGGFGYVGPPNTLKLNMETSFKTWVDYQRLNTISNNVQMYYGSPYYSEFIFGLVKTQFIRFLTNPFRPLYQGTYQARFYFNTPYFMCTDPDYSNPGILKSYTY